MKKDININDYLEFINGEEVRNTTKKIDNLPEKYQKLREVLNISDDNFLDLLAAREMAEIDDTNFFAIAIFAKRYIQNKLKNSSLTFPEELLCEIIKSAMESHDYNFEENGLNNQLGYNLQIDDIRYYKDPFESTRRAIKNII